MVFAVVVDPAIYAVRFDAVQKIRTPLHGRQAGKKP